MNISFREVEDAEVFIYNGQFHTKASNTLGQSFAVNLETGLIEDEILLDDIVEVTDIRLSSLWE